MCKLQFFVIQNMIIQYQVFQTSVWMIYFEFRKNLYLHFLRNEQIHEPCDLVTSGENVN
jgi:hypothetical protein